MPSPQRYRPRPDRPVAAVQMNLETAGLHYRKWGGEQHGKPGDWLVDNGGDVYTVDATSFARSYRRTGVGTYVKVSCVWAERAAADGHVDTFEGRSAYAAGDYVVSNNEDGTDAYAVPAQRFEAAYERDA
jgi:hypothetical protein